MRSNIHIYVYIYMYIYIYILDTYVYVYVYVYVHVCLYVYAYTCIYAQRTEEQQRATPAQEGAAEAPPSHEEHGLVLHRALCAGLASFFAGQPGPAVLATSRGFKVTGTVE